MSARKKGSYGYYSSSIENSYKTLYANIRFATVDKPIRSICLTSSVMGEAKTATSLNLAKSVAESGKRVLIVECDLRRRQVAKRLNVRPAVGLFGLLSGEAQINDAIVATSIRNLFVLDAEPNIPNPPDVLGSGRFAALVKHLATQFDFVIYDTPPAGLFVDSSLVSKLVDGTLFVIHQNSTKKAEIDKAMGQLTQAGGRILGTVLTFCKASKEDYYYYSYYNEDGKKIEKSNRPQSTTGSFQDGDVSSWERHMGISENAAGKAPSTGKPGARPTRTASGASARPATSKESSARPSTGKPVRQDSRMASKPTQQSASASAARPAAANSSTGGSSMGGSTAGNPATARPRTDSSFVPLMPNKNAQQPKRK